jgi:hypothetical protein
MTPPAVQGSSFLATHTKSMKLLKRRKHPASIRWGQRIVNLLLLFPLLQLTSCATAPQKRTDQQRRIVPEISALPAPYMRIARPEAGSVTLEIAARRFLSPSGGPVIWLVGASHIGDSNYFTALQMHLERQALVLYEGVGVQDKKMRVDSEDDSSIQTTLAKSLGVCFQLSALDYDRPHFQNSDLSIAQLQKLMAEDRSKSGAGAGHQPNQEFQQLLEIMQGSSWLGALVHVGIKMIAASPKLQAVTKLMLIETLGQLTGDLAQMKGLPPEMQRLMAVIIQERNKTVIGDLKKALTKEHPPASIAIFYGAGHMADFEKRLGSELKFRPAGEIWLRALVVNTQDTGLLETEINALRSLIQLQLQSLQP